MCKLNRDGNCLNTDPEIYNISSTFGVQVSLVFCTCQRFTEALLSLLLRMFCRIKLSSLLGNGFATSNITLPNKHATSCGISFIIMV